MAKPPAQIASIDPQGEFPFDLGTYFFNILLVTMRHRDARLEQLVRPVGLDLAMARALMVIYRLGSCTMNELADYGATDRTTMPRVVDRLVRAELVERDTPPGDRRKVVLSLTQAGGRALAGTAEVTMADNDGLLDGLPEHELRAVARLMRQVVARLVDEPHVLKRVLWES
jgi:DNA-binding MarR family transcriptional regulator